jgi:hypothetical protein
MSDKDYNSQIASFRAPVERLVAHFKSWKIFHTDYRRPYETYRDSFDAVRGYSSHSYGVLNNPQRWFAGIEASGIVGADQLPPDGNSGLRVVLACLCRVGRLPFSQATVRPKWTLSACN